MLPRKRVLDPALFHDFELFTALKPRPERGYLLYQGLWCIAEDSGVYEPKYANIASQMGVLKFRAGEVERYVRQMVVEGKVVPYSHREREYHWLKNFKKHQNLNNPALPKLPLPPWVHYEVREVGKSKRKCAVFTENSEKLVAYLKSDCSLLVAYMQDTCTAERKGQERKESIERHGGSADKHAEASGLPSSEKELYDEDRERELFRKYRPHLEEQCAVLLRHFQGKNGEAGGFNPMHFIAKAKRARIPIEVVKEVLDSMVRQKGSIKNPWGWITTVLDSEYKEHNFIQALKEHEERKRWSGIPERLGRLLGG
jgi:hypothetical protein